MNATTTNNNAANDVVVDNSIAEAEDSIRKNCSAVGCTEDGRLWIEESLDPFTDTPKRHTGFPDLITGRSVVQVIRQTTTYTNTSGAAQDVHVFMDSLDTGIDMQSSTKYTHPVSGNVYPDVYYAPTATPPTYKRGGVRIRSGSVGAPLYMPNTLTQGIDLPQQYFDDGYTRVISKGFEIHNTTPLLQVGGSVIAYRDASTMGYEPRGVATILSATAGTPDIAKQHVYPRYPLPAVPTTAAEALLLPDSRQWEAKDGVYCVATMNQQENDPYQDAVGIASFHDPSQASTSDWTSWENNNSTNGLPSVNQNLHPSPFFVSGAYFTGLPNTTNLTITAIWVVERFIDNPNSQLITMSQPSPHYDPVSLELYARTSAKLPVGTKVKNNADGDWIKDIADTLSLFGVPGMPLVKKGVDLYNNLTAKRNVNKQWNQPQPQRERQRKQAENQPQPVIIMRKSKQQPKQKQQQQQLKGKQAYVIKQNNSK